MADLGCGDARVLIEAIKQEAESAQGWELDVLVYLRAKRNLVTAQRLGVDTRSISLHFGDFWRARLESVDVVYVYQMTKYMHPLEEKIISQLKPGALIISPDYQIPGLTVWKYIDDGDRGVYVYKKQ